MCFYGWVVGFFKESRNGRRKKVGRKEVRCLRGRGLNLEWRE